MEKNIDNEKYEAFLEIFQNDEGVNSKILSLIRDILHKPHG